MDFTSLAPGVLANFDEWFEVYRGVSSAEDHAVVVLFVDPETKEEHWFGLTPAGARRLADALQQEADAIDR